MTRNFTVDASDLRVSDPHTQDAATSNPCRLCRLKGAELCHAVIDSHTSGVRTARTRRFKRDAIIYEEGDTPGFLGVVRSGVLRRERLNSDGDRTLLALAVAGDLVGALSPDPSSCSLEAATDAEICMFSPDTVSRMMDADNRFRLHILHEIGEQHQQLLDMIWQRGALTARERIINILLHAVKTMPTFTSKDGSVIVKVEISRKDWADLANTTVETICRTLSWLADQDLVVSERANTYRIRDIRALCDLTGNPDDAPCPQEHR